MNSEKAIETEGLFIRGNIMSWPGTMIQLSNVSSISTSDLVLVPIPKAAIVLILLGLVGFSFNPLVGIVVILVGLAWLGIWFVGNEERKNTKNLNIMLNSGTNLNIQIRNKEFLATVVDVLYQILIDGGIGDRDISINIQDCSFSGNAEVLNNLGINNRN